MEFEEVKNEGFTPIEKGFTTIGQLLEVEPSRTYESSFAIIIKEEDGTIVRFWGNKILKDKLEGLQFKKIKVEYIGKKETEDKKKTYHDWKVYTTKE